MASQRFHFTVDQAHNKANNELSRDTKRLQISAGVFGALLLLIAAGLWFAIAHSAYLYMAVIALLTFGLLSFIIMLVVPQKVGSAQSIYDSYDLVPAIVAEVNPRDCVLMALVNVNVNPELPPRWGLATRTVTGLVGHEKVVGERVPSVAVSGRRSVSDKEHWQEIAPMPIAWGTPDTSVIKEAEQKIPAEQWRKLEKIQDKLSEVKETPLNLLVLK